MRRRSGRIAAIVVAAGWVLVAVLTLWAPVRARSVREDPRYPCSFTPRRDVWPLNPVLGAEVAITTSLVGDCHGDSRPLHIVIVVDASEQMVDRGRDWLPVLLGDLEAAILAVTRDGRMPAEVGIVSFRDRVASTESYLTDDAEDLVRALHDVGVSPGRTCLQCGLREGLRKARRVLQSGRDDRAPDATREVIIIASRGFEPSSCDAVRAAATEVKALLVTACGGGSCDRRCLAEAATDEVFAFASGTWSYLSPTLEQLVTGQGLFHPVEDVLIVDMLADQLLYARGGDPNAGVGNRLEWSFQPWPKEGVTRTYHARSIDTGRFRASTYVSATVRYNALLWADATQSLAFDNPELNVSYPTATPTPTTAEPETVTPPATVTATATGTAAPDPTWPPRPRSAYVPMAVRRGCASSVERLDVALLIDVSGSMAVSDVGRMASRWDAAGYVAEELVKHHLQAGDRVAVIPFADRAELRVGLTDGPERAKVALRALPKWDGSRLDLAIQVGHEELVGAPGACAACGVMVLITDGDLNQAPMTALRERADAARADGIRFLAVALGGDADEEALTDVVGAPHRVLSTQRTPVLDLADAVGRVWRCRR